MISHVPYTGWGKNCYHVASFEEFNKIRAWMYEHEVENNLMSSGSSGYTFKVETNIEWFILKWNGQ